MPFKAVVFDLDGTLLDTLDDLADSATRVLATHRFPVHPVELTATLSATCCRLW